MKYGSYIFFVSTQAKTLSNIWYNDVTFSGILFLNYIFNDTIVYLEEKCNAIMTV